MDDKNAGESTILSNSEKMRKEVDEDEGGDLGEEEEVTEEDESENDEEEEQQLDGIKLSKNPLVVKDPWTYGEDMDLKKLVEKYGAKNWSVIAKKLTGNKCRIGKQCRERWHNHLNPAVNKTNWSAKEDNIIDKYQRVYGNKWAEIAKHLSGRTDNSIKNRYYSTQRKKQRHAFKESYSYPSPNTDDSPTGSLPDVVGLSSFPLHTDSPSHLPGITGGGVLGSPARHHVRKRKVTSQQTERVAGEEYVTDDLEDTDDSYGILTTSHRISLLQRLLKKGMGENDDISGWKAASHPNMGIALTDPQSSVDSMDDLQLREYMLLLSAPWAKAIAEGIPEPIGPTVISPRPSVIMPRLPSLFTEECIAKWGGLFRMPHISSHFSPSLPELPIVGVRLPHWQVELLNKDKIDIFDGAEVVGVALKSDLG
eukprot:307217_1